MEIDILPDSALDFLESPVQTVKPTVRLAPGALDPRLGRSSYSSSSLFNGCQRKYQLSKLTQQYNRDNDWRTELTFSFGHTVGDAIQKHFLGHSYESIVLDMLCGWKAHLYSENDKQKKSFFEALEALDIFISMRNEGFMSEYELVYYEDKPAIELGLKIRFPTGNSYRGFVDLVLRNKETRISCIVDTKTDSGVSLNPNKYKNSGQALGYSVVLDKIEPDYSDYTVYYLVYMTRLRRWEMFEFPKTRVQRSLWLRDRVWESDQLDLLASEFGTYGVWPVNGNSCMSWNRECEFLGNCTTDTKLLTQPLTEDLLTEDDSQFTFIYNVEDLL